MKENVKNNVVEKDLLKNSIEITQYLLALGLVVLFSFTGMEKILGLAEFQDALKNSPFIPEWASWPVAIVTTMLFFGLSILLLLGFWKARAMRIGFGLSTGLLLIFTLYIAAIITIAPYQPCICIGLDEKLRLGWGAHLLLNGILLAVAWTATLLSYINKKFIAMDEATPGL